MAEKAKSWVSKLSEKVKSANAFAIAAIGIIGLLWGAYSVADSIVSQKRDAEIAALRQDVAEIKEMQENLLEVTNSNLTKALIELYRIDLGNMIREDMGVGKMKDFIMARYDQLMEICPNCPSSEFRMKEYLESLK